MSAEISQDIERAAQLLRACEVVAIPTETVYGLAANALDVKAVVKIFEAKKRPHFDPLIVHVASIEEAQKLVLEFPPIAQQLAAAYWPGPLTMVLRKKEHVPDLVTSGLPTVGIRMPDHPVTLQLLQLLDFPLAAPSANPFGFISPTSAQHVQDQLGEKIPYILDGGKCDVGLESTIVDLSGAEPVILRLGGLSVEQLQSQLGDVKVHTTSSSSPAAPGMLISHYAPRKKFFLGDLDSLISIHSTTKMAILSFQKAYNGFQNKILSPSGDMQEAAKNLFAFMRELDASDADVIIAEPVPDVGLGRAINDKLRRASSKL